MLIPHHPEALEGLRRPTAADPLRVLVSGCLAGWRCGVTGDDNGLGGLLSALFALPTVRVLAFCPEQHALGTPRGTPDLHGGDGFDVLEGRATAQDEHGNDLTDAMIAGARAMATFAQAERAELALLTDASAACGSEVISEGSRFAPVRRHQKGVGVATAALLQLGLPVLSQRDHTSLARLRALLGAPEAPAAGPDHRAHPWVLANLPKPNPRA